jgi:hypothetical protein
VCVLYRLIECIVSWLQAASWELAEISITIELSWLSHVMECGDPAIVLSLHPELHPMPSLSHIPFLPFTLILSSYYTMWVASKSARAATMIDNQSRVPNEVAKWFRPLESVVACLPCRTRADGVSLSKGWGVIVRSEEDDQSA